MEYISLYLLLINALCFLLMLIDKVRAVKNRWRIPEKTLLTFALLGGSFGGLLAMKLFHHKTKKPLFAIGFPVIFAFWAVAAIFLLFYARIV